MANVDMSSLRRRPGSRRIAAGRAWLAASIGGRGYRRVRELDLDTHALALCAQQVLCTAPLIVAISAVLQRLRGHGIARGMARFFGLHGASQHDVRQLFGRSAPSISTLTLVFGMITAIVFTTSVAATQQRGFELIWTLPRVSGLRSYFRQLLWTPALTVFSLVVLAAGRIGHWTDGHVVGLGAWTATTVQGILTFLFYWWTQHWLLGSRVTWRALLPGSIAVGLLTSVMVRISREIIPPEIAWSVHAYGLIGGVFVLSVWLMVLSIVIFGGVLLGALLTERRAEKRAERGLVPAAEELPLTVAGLESTAGQEFSPR
jgi:membrane protein